MAEQLGTQTITSPSDRQKSVPVVTVDSFYNSHAEKLQMKLEGPQVGFHRKIREPTINRPGLALSGFYTYFAEKRVDRKSTRLNSSHVAISYAVFCLKKKKTPTMPSSLRAYTRSIPK